MLVADLILCIKYIIL